jgi:hypothetical protein
MKTNLTVKVVAVIAAITVIILGAPALFNAVSFVIFNLVLPVLAGGAILFFIVFLAYQVGKIKGRGGDKTPPPGE